MLDYKHPIEILRVTTKTDELANQIETVEPFYKCRARVNWVSGNENLTAAADRQTDELTFIIRWCKQAAAIKTELFRVRFRGEVYDIKHVDNYMYQDRELKIKAVRVR